MKKGWQWFMCKIILSIPNYPVKQIFGWMTGIPWISGLKSFRIDRLYQMELFFQKGGSNVIVIGKSRYLLELIRSFCIKGDV